VLVGLPSVSLSDSQRWRTIAASPADHGNGDLGKADRLDDRLPGHDALDELGFRLDLAARMAVAKLFGRKLLQLALIRFEQCLPERLDRLVDRCRIGRIGHSRATL